MTRIVPFALALLLPAAALAQSGGSVTQNPPVPSRPPVVGPTGSSVASDATRAPPERIAPPEPGTVGPASLAPVTGSHTQPAERR